MRLLLLIFFVFFSIAPVSAAPLTNYDFAKIALDAGIITPRVSTTYNDGSGALLCQYGSNYGLNYSATMGLGQPFAVRIHGDAPLFGNDNDYRFASQNAEFLWGFHLNQPTFLVLYTGLGVYQLGGNGLIGSSPLTALKFGLILDYEWRESASIYADFSWSGDATTITAGADYKLAEALAAGVAINGVILHSGTTDDGPLANKNCFAVAVWYPELSVTYKF